jgi:lysozyme family protein
MKPQDFVGGYIRDHEGGLSVDPDDTGNWYKGVCVGSKFGVTGAVLCSYRDIAQITPQEMAALDMGEAVDIGMKMFYTGPGLDQLPWNQLTASVLDMGWGSGPKQAVKLLQRMIVCGDDGSVGTFTARAYADFLKNHGLEDSAQMWGDVRNQFYDKIIQVRPSNAKYRNGWRNRTASFLPGTKWWKNWPT